MTTHTMTIEQAVELNRQDRLFGILIGKNGSTAKLYQMFGTVAVLWEKSDDTITRTTMVDVQVTSVYRLVD